MTDHEISLDRAHWTESESLAQLIAYAFHYLPLTEWLVPDPIDRREVMPEYFRLLVDRAMANGAVYTTTDRRAAALWLPIVPGFTRVLPDDDRRLGAACGLYAVRFQAFEKVLDEHHPDTAAHHHLAILAVAPDHQCRGIGSAMLRAYHEFLDREQSPAYLEAASPRSVNLYRRHGYQLRAGGPFHLPDGGPPVWPMWRPPGA